MLKQLKKAMKRISRGAKQAKSVRNNGFRTRSLDPADRFYARMVCATTEISDCGNRCVEKRLYNGIAHGEGVLKQTRARWKHVSTTMMHQRNLRVLVLSSGQWLKRWQCLCNYKSDWLLLSFFNFPTRPRIPISLMLVHRRCSWEHLGTWHKSSNVKFVQWLYLQTQALKLKLLCNQSRLKNVIGEVSFWQWGSWIGLSRVLQRQETDLYPHVVLIHFFNECCLGS